MEAYKYPKSDNLKIKSSQFDEIERGEDSNFEVIEESENYENSETQLVSKKEIIGSFAHKNLTLSTKNIDKEKDEITSPSILITGSNNEIKESLNIKYSDIYKSSKTRFSHATKASSEESKALKNPECLNSESKFPELLSCNYDIDRVFNFKRYFPNFNIKNIIKNIPNCKTMMKEINKRYFKKYKELKIYSFYANPILERFYNEKNKCSTVQSRARLRNSKTIKITTALHKKQFFEFQETKKEISNFTELISTLVVKKKQSTLEFKNKTFSKH